TAPSTVAGWVRQGYRDDPLDSPDPDHPALAELPLPKLDPRDEARYVVRCVYERPQCGPLHDPVVSARSADFAIGSDFDLDAPAREIQIALPLDTSPGGLRKFRKNVSFVLSDQLQKQMSAVKGLQETLDGDVGGQSWGIGFICSFSIPIITLCAFFVLMI